MAREHQERHDMNDVRAFAEQSVTQAKTAIERMLKGAGEAVEHLEGRAEAVQTGAKDIARKSMTYAEQNVAASFDFVEKLVQAKDAAEVMRLQSEFLGRQMQALSAQVQDLGRSAAKITADTTKSPR